VAKPIHLVRAPIDATRGSSNDAAEPLAPEPADALRVLEICVDRARRGVRGALATVVARHGSAPGTPGQKLFVAADGVAVGTVGGGAVEREVTVALRRMLEAGRSGKHEVRSFKLGAELGMCCGGSLDVMLEPIEALVPVLMVGGGHVASSCAPMLARLGFAVTVVDARDAWGREGRLPGVTCVVGDYDDVGQAFPVHGAVLVMTHDHALDQDVVEWALKMGFAYVGGVGSRAKAKRTRDRLSAKGFSAQDCARVRMPIGIDVGARLPEEIAVAISAEMIAWRRSPAQVGDQVGGTSNTGKTSNEP
jgi:xanthine dehydrogenase accessory factor